MVEKLHLNNGWFITFDFQAKFRNGYLNVTNLKLFLNLDKSTIRINVELNRRDWEKKSQ